jgi:hypothetical protein
MPLALWDALQVSSNGIYVLQCSPLRYGGENQLEPQAFERYTGELLHGARSRPHDANSGCSIYVGAERMILGFPGRLHPNLL